VRAVTKVPAIVLLVVLAILPIQAWFAAGRSDVRIDRPLDEMPSVTWAGTVRADGDVAVSITYELEESAGRVASIRLPDGAHLLTVNGEPAAADSGKYGTADASGTLTVGYEVSGRVTRYADGVVVDFSGLAYQTQAESLYGSDSFNPDTSDGDQGLFPCARCYLDVEGYGHSALYGALFADALDGDRIAVGGVDQLNVEQEGGAVRFVAMLTGADDANMVAVLPVAAAPDAPTLADRAPAITPENAAAADEPVGDAGSAREAYDELRARATRASIPMGEASSSAPIGKAALAFVLSAMWVALVAWIGWRIAAARRALSADRADDSLTGSAAFSPPSTLEPALVSVVVGGAGPGDRSITAATLLALAHRGVIRIEGLDSQRYTLTVPMGARGSTPTEEAVLDELRPQGQTTSTATFTGPPLWGDDAPAVARRLKKVVMKEAHKAKLLRVTLAAGVLVPASLAMGLVALIGSQGDSILAWIVTFAGPVVAFFAAALTGVNLTARGRTERDRWVRYGEWLRANSQLEDVGAPGIVTWGEPLIYATVLGAAPKAAKALGVRGGD
jgi:hypothetical protein